MSPGGRIYSLYDLDRDEAEENDISGRDKGVLQRMIAAFDEKHASLHEIRTDAPAQ